MDGRGGFIHRLKYDGVSPAVRIRVDRGTKIREFTPSKQGLVGTRSSYEGGKVEDQY